MPRNSGGVYSLPTGNPVVVGTVIESDWANTTLTDVANAMTDSLSRTGSGGMLVPLEVADGTASNPAYSFTAAPTTGMYRDTATGEVRISIATKDVVSFPASGTKIEYNLLINSVAAWINQRAVSGSVVLAADEYGHDRWKGGAAGCTYTFATSAGVTTITISAGTLVQVVEGLSLSSGTHVLQWTGTCQGQIDGGGFGISGVTGSLTGGTNATVEFGIGTLSKVKFELGSIPSKVVQRSIGEEFSLCQRFFQKSSDLSVTSLLFSGMITDANTYSAPQTFPVIMSGTPNVVLTDSGSATGFPNTSGSVGSPSPEGFREFRTSNATLPTGFYSSAWTSEAEL